MERTWKERGKKKVTENRGSNHQVPIIRLLLLPREHTTLHLWYLMRPAVSCLLQVRSLDIVMIVARMKASRQQTEPGLVVEIESDQRQEHKVNEDMEPRRISGIWQKPMYGRR